MISKKCFVANLALIILLSSLSVISVNGKETYSTEVIATTSVANTASSSQQGDHIIILSIDPGVKQIGYLAFDISDLPDNATPISCRFKIKCAAVSEICHISAFCSSGAEWIGNDLTWETKPEIDEFVSSNWIDTMKDWYSYESKSLNDEVNHALNNDGLLSISLSTGINSVNQYGIIGFYPDAVLEIDYIIELQDGSTEETQLQSDEMQDVPDKSGILSDIIVILFLIAVIVVGLALILKWRK